jgi:peptidoglycan hydrolase-like protein with peptidoglycan-binding domain
MNIRHVLFGVAAITLTAAPALAAPPAATATTAPPVAAAPAKPVASKANRHEALYRSAQQKLKSMNLYSGPVDGQRSATFIKSVENFQRDHKLKVTGRMNAETSKALGI